MKFKKYVGNHIMFYICDRFKENGKLKLKFKEEIHIAGCKNGIICKELNKKLKELKNKSCKWHLPISEIYQVKNQSVIIDIKPKNKNETFLCELTDVWGYSSEEWTPVLLRLNILYDVPEKSINKLLFDYPEKVDSIFSMSHLTGSISKGTLIGRWNPPRPGLFNSVLLGRDTLNYFIKKIGEKDPNFLIS